MNEQDLRDALTKAANSCQLSEYRKRQIVAQMKGEEPVKKKLTLSVVLVMIITLLTLGAAAALVHSTITEQLFGSSENAPAEVTERIQTLQETAKSDIGSLSLDEWFYDGQALHTAFSISNPTDQPLFYTLDGIKLNGEQVSYNRLRTEGAGDSGFLLGGTLEGVKLPSSVTLYNQGDALYAFDENGKYSGQIPIPEGTKKLEISVAVWKPLNPVELLDYKQYEGSNINEAKDHLTVDSNGYSQLWLFRPEEYNLNYNGSQSGAQVYKDAYKELGWMELLDLIKVEASIHPSKEKAIRAIPEITDFVLNDCRLTVEQFDFSHAGGILIASILGDADQIDQFTTQHGFRLVDLENSKLLSGGCFWDSLPENEEGLRIELHLDPLSTDIPRTVYFVPATAYVECYDPASPKFDAELIRPNNVIEGWEVDLANAIAIPLQITP